MYNKNTLQRWGIFTWERFFPLTHIPFLSLYFFAHYTFLSEQNNFSVWKMIFLYFCTLIFFYKLRLYDEIKDFDNDLKIYPMRPLSRGLLGKNDLLNGIIMCIGLEILIFFTLGITGLVAIIPTIIYSLLMFKEFFIGKWLRLNLTLYAITHTIASSLFSLSIISSVEKTHVWQLDKAYYLFALLSWFLFNIFEFGRKTFVTSEEREKVESYSKIYGRLGASLLVFLMTICTYLILFFLFKSNLILYSMVASLALITLVSILFSTLNKKPWGTIYRTITFVFIAMVYFVIIIVSDHT